MWVSEVILRRARAARVRAMNVWDELDAAAAQSSPTGTLPEEHPD
jgi:hypothetical protein